MKITTAELAGPHDVYVAGSFSTQVWNGDQHEFVKIFNIAHYNSINQVWLPLPVGQITCSWCTVTVLALAWDSTRKQLHVAGKFNAIDGENIPSGLALYDATSGHLVAHPGGGLTMLNRTQDGVGTALQLDEEAGVLYVMGSFERLGTDEICFGLAAYEITSNHWTCLADAAHTVMPSGGGNMLLTPYGLMVAGRTTSYSTWPDSSRPYTIALLKASVKDGMATDSESNGDAIGSGSLHDFEWSWLPGFNGHSEPLHALANGFGEYEGTVFISGDNFVAKWYYEERIETIKVPSTTVSSSGRSSSSTSVVTKSTLVPVTINFSGDYVKGAIMAIAQLSPEEVYTPEETSRPFFAYTIAVYFIALGALLGMFLALLCNKSITQTIGSFLFSSDASIKGISLDMLTYGAVENTSVSEAYQRAMRTRFVEHPHLLTLIDPQEIILHRIIGEGTFGRVWSAKWRSASVAVKEFVFAQAAVAGKSVQQREIIEEIIGEAGMMAILRHPNVLQLFGCSLTAQAIWIVSELCSLGSLRQLLDDKDYDLPIDVRVSIALQVAEGMTYLHNQDPPIIHRDLKSHNIFVHATFSEKAENKGPVHRYGLREGSASKRQLLSQHHHTDPMEKIASEATIVAKIGDWGSARATLSGSRTMTHGVGTACWLAPEVIKHARSSKFSDVYGYGIVLWELATREEVYSGLESTQIIARVANDNLRPPPPLNNPFTSLMIKCWSENPHDRPHFPQIVEELNRIANLLRSPPSYQNDHVDHVEGMNNGSNGTMTV
jgi:serine/threonine protein kinase